MKRLTKEAHLKYHSASLSFSGLLKNIPIKKGRWFIVQTSAQRILEYIGLLALVVLLSACSLNEDPHDQPAAGAPGNVLRIDVDADFGSFAPCLAECSGSTYVFPYIYSFLFVLNPQGDLEPDLAVNWDYDPKTFTWRIGLRQDALFHDGVPVTAADAAYSLRSFAENSRKIFGNKLKKITATDTYVLEIQLNQDDPSFLNSLWDLEMVPDPGRHSNLDLKGSPVGSGPFKFDRRTDDGRVIFAANEHYYNGRPAIDRVVFTYIPRGEDSWARLIKGETDIVGNLTVKNYQIIEQYADRFYFAKSSWNYYSILLYNTHHPLFENPMVRRALTHAIDRDYMVQNMLNGMAEKVSGPLGNRTACCDPDLKPLAYDPPLALRYLEKAGWTLDPDTHYLVKNGQGFEFELLLRAGNDADLKVARFIQLCLNEIGIRVHLKAMPTDAFYNFYSRNTDFEAVLTELTANDRRPEEVLEVWVTSRDLLSQAGGFDSPEATRLTGLTLTAKDPETRKALFQQFDQLIADLQPGSFLFQKIYIDAMSRRFALNHPFSFDYPGLYRLKDARLKNEGK
ncbi:MAG: ABC transporter substrate-binding protein [Desulfobacteraceae bacterium]|nr:MAG: ABC transporter substrate-binding protein [Desulfobacteraceae bacterium]